MSTERLGGHTGRLVRLDGLVRAAKRTDWPGRERGPEVRTVDTTAPEEG